MESKDRSLSSRTSELVSVYLKAAGNCEANFPEMRAAKRSVTSGVSVAVASWMRRTDSIYLRIQLSCPPTLERWLDEGGIQNYDAAH